MSTTTPSTSYDESLSVDTAKFDEYVELARQGSLFSQLSTFPEFFAPKPAPLTLSFGR